MHSRFAKVRLSLIVLALLVIACTPLFQPNLANAAGPVQYKLVSGPQACSSRLLGTQVTECEQSFNDHGKEGRRYVTGFAAHGQGGHFDTVILFTK